MFYSPGCVQNRNENGNKMSKHMQKKVWRRNSGKYACRQKSKYRLLGAYGEIKEAVVEYRKNYWPELLSQKKWQKNSDFRIYV